MHAGVADLAADDGEGGERAGTAAFPQHDEHCGDVVWVHGQGGHGVLKGLCKTKSSHFETTVPRVKNCVMNTYALK